MVVDKVGAPFELPIGISRIVDKNENVGAVIALGVLVKSSDIIFDQKVAVVTQGLMQVSLAKGLPLVNGVLATEEPVDTAQAGQSFADSGVRLAVGGRCSATAMSPLATTTDAAVAVAAAAGSTPPPAPAGANAASKTAGAAGDAKDTEKLLDALRESLKKHGARGIVGLGRKFKIMDDDRSRSVSCEEFGKAIAEHALGFTEQDVAALFGRFDEDGSGQLSYDEFLQGVRGELNQRREQLVLQAFTLIDADNSGVLELGDVMRKYNADKHPEVLQGSKTASEVLREFLDTFDGGEKDGKVYPAEFLRYYANVSASVDDDDYFELMIRNAWHISGGEGWCANTTCRRVLVTAPDGTQSVQEVKDDLGIAADDKAAIKAKLAEQGVAAAEIATTGSVDTTQKPRTPGRGQQRGGGTSSIVFG